MDCSTWNSPGKNTGVGNLFLLQGIFPTQGSNPGLPHCRWILYHLSHKGSPRILEWVAYPFSSGSSWPGIELGSPALHVDSLPTEIWGIWKEPGKYTIRVFFLKKVLEATLQSIKNIVHSFQPSRVRPQQESFYLVIGTNRPRPNQVKPRSKGNLFFFLMDIWGQALAFISLFLSSPNREWVLFYWPCRTWDLSSHPGIEPLSPAVEAQNLTHWAARKVPESFIVWWKDGEV